jgi:asparagine synthase (glutamine-hydrolysing)
LRSSRYRFPAGGGYCCPESGVCKLSGFFGRFEFDGRPVGHSGFRAQFIRAQHFGPDHSSWWVDGNLGIGQHLLFISRAAEKEALPSPFQNEVLIADAILDDREALCDRLHLARTDAESLSDHDLIRKSYARWGEGCVEYLLGDYAFAVIDRHRQEVRLVRDPIGTRPLFWARRNTTLTFGTSIDALIADPEVAWPICERSVAEHLAWPFDPSPEPLYQHIHRVPPGSILLLRQEGVSRNKWWRPERYIAENRRRDEDLIEEAGYLLERAVGDRVDTSYNTGSHLSGGIDSTSIAILAARRLKKSESRLTNCYSWSPVVGDQYPIIHPTDERPKILRIAGTEGIDVRLADTEQNPFLEFLDRSFEREGPADLIDEMPIMARAREDKVRVLLSGWGGDEGFSTAGAGYAVGMMLEGNWTRAFRFSRSSGYAYSSPRQAASSVWHAFVLPLLHRELQNRLSRPNLLNANQSFASPYLQQRYGTDMRHATERPVAATSLKKNLVRRIQSDHLPMRMETWAAMSAHYGFQYRYPMTDRRLIEFLLSLNEDQILLGRQPRGLARAVLSRLSQEQLTKFDPANEQRRRDVRETGWQALAQRIGEGDFDGDCPWISKDSFIEKLANPLPQTKQENIALFYELFTAVRIYRLYRRTRPAS